MVEGKRLGFLEKVILGVAGITSIFTGANAIADSLDITLDDVDDPYFTYVQVQQTSGAKEPGKGIDINDDIFLEGVGSRVNFYLRNVDGDFTAEDREPNSTSDFYGRIEGVDLLGTVQMQPKFYLSEQSEGNFDWKNMIIDLYDSNDINDSNNLIGTYDGHDLANGNTSFPNLTIKNGLCYQMLIKPRHFADLNFDQKIDFSDFSLFGLYWDNNNANETNFWNSYSDINRNEKTDTEDLSNITGNNWLWEQDPNLMSKTTPAYDAANPQVNSTIIPKFDDGKNVLNGKYLASFQKEAENKFYDREAA